MWKPVATFVGGLLLALMTIGLVFMVGMRRKSPLVLRAVRRFNRDVGNPYQMKTAGTPGAYASVIRHVGRTTGRPYETPVRAEPTEDGFVIALPYGTQADWLKNVLTNGSATIVDEGTSYQVDQPVIIPMAVVAHHFPLKDQRNLPRFRVNQCLQVRRVESDEASAPVADPV